MIGHCVYKCWVEELNTHLDRREGNESANDTYASQCWESEMKVVDIERKTIAVAAGRGVSHDASWFNAWPQAPDYFNASLHPPFLPLL